MRLSMTSLLSLGPSRSIPSIDPAHDLLRVRQSLFSLLHPILCPQDSFFHGNDMHDGSLDAQPYVWRRGQPLLFEFGKTFLKEAISIGHVAATGVSCKRS